MKLFETIIDEEQIHYNYFDNVDEHIKTLGDTYLAKIAGTPASTGLTPKGFAIGTAAPHNRIWRKTRIGQRQKMYCCTLR